MELPSFLKEYESEINEYEKLVGAIQFSGSTYQIQVANPDAKEECWVFLQLGEKGEIKDSFCSCEEEDAKPGCEHLAAAYKVIFGNFNQPLHRRFKNSLWNKLCLLFAEKMNYSAKPLRKIKKGFYEARSITKKLIFEIEATEEHTADLLKNLIEERPKETEETSLKFSNLSVEEIDLWRAGRPSTNLRYELSFWNDLAKWMLELQEKGNPYEITFIETQSGLPQWVEVIFHKQFGVYFYLSSANLPLIIPALTTVNTSLKVHGFEKEGIHKVVYDQEQQTLAIFPVIKIDGEDVMKEKPPRNGYVIDGWEYVSKDGFYPINPKGLRADTVLHGDDVTDALEYHHEELKAYLNNESLNSDPVSVSYQINFDQEMNLHIVSYIFEPGDLQQPYSRFYGSWAYLQDDGFYKIEGKQFEEAELIIPQADISVFVSQHRSWLNTQEGFQTHLVNIEAQLSYQVDADWRLEFTHITADSPLDGAQFDFGRWVYIPEQGFYQKMGSQINLPIRAGVTLPQEQVPLFIRMHRDELALMPHFFASESPFSSCGLSVRLTRYRHIEIAPEWYVKPDRRQKAIHLYGDFSYAEGEGFYELPMPSKIREIFGCPLDLPPGDIDEFVEFILPEIKEYVLSLDTKLTKPQRLELVAEQIEKKDSVGEKVYEVKFHYHSEIGVVSAVEVWKAVKAKKRYAATPAGLFDLKEDRFNWLRHFAAELVDKKKMSFSLTTLQLLKLNAFDTVIAPEGGRGRSVANTHEILKEITEFKAPEPPDLTGLKSSLRSYQEIGLMWLWFLYHQSLSGLLCDDMGLGKTHQAMAIIAASRNHFPELPYKKHYLVVCPTSVIYHWEEKLQKFLPDLKICSFFGSKRSFSDFKSDYDLLLTSYGIWRLESKLLSQVYFEIAILDEVQTAKNYQSQLHASLLAIQAKMRLGLTGTPIENHLRELKSLFDIVLPSYMPGDMDYRRFFVRPIEKEQNLKRKAILAKFIKPFMLRRKKEEVLKDLPEKTEELSYCPLSNEQIELYNSILAGERPKIMQEMENHAKPVPYVHIFAILSSLKQVCNHPAVYLKDPENYKKYRSGKWELFLELLHEVRDSGLKVVVFSQYLTQLDIIQAYLKEKKIRYAQIRGSTVNRGEEIKRFHEDPKCEVFLASLQAAGLGIDLTAASVVVHYDRWWNAARENQATDRVHRIGQQRGVQVFKLVTKGSFEERINEMIESKGALMEEIVAADDHRALKQLDRNQILELLKDIQVGNEDPPVITEEEEEQ